MIRDDFVAPLGLILLLIFVGGHTATAKPETTRRNVQVEWDAIEGATLYEIQLQRKESARDKQILFKTNVPQWSGNVKPGFYTMQIRSYDDRGAPGDWSPPSDLQVKLPSILLESPKTDAEIACHEEDECPLSLRWQEVEGAVKYRVTLQSTTSSWRHVEDVTEPRWSVRVPVAQSFTWNVQALEANGELGEVNAEAFRFQVKGPPLAPPRLERPLSKYVDHLSWAASPKAKAYRYELKFLNPQTKKWETIASENEHQDTHLAIDISRPTGRYRLKVQAQGERRAPSAIQIMDFEMFGGFHDPTSLQHEMLRDSMRKPTHFYAIASYLITQIQYQAANRDSGAAAAFHAVGGTGRLGLGWQSPESQWGAFGIVDESGFVISGQTFKFASVEGHLTHKLEFGQAGLLLMGAGLFSKELPIVQGSQFTAFEGVGRVREMGPHAGFSYWAPINQRLGVQVNARLYEGLLGQATNGQKIEPSLSYQYGALGSYRLSPAWMGFVGYAYRLDRTNYPANSSDPLSFAYGHPGSSTIQIQGNYLNLLLEFSF